MKQSIKKLLLTSLIIMTALLATACGASREKPEAYVKAQLEDIVAGNQDVYDTILTDALAEEEIENMSDEIKEEYKAFFKELYSNMEFNVETAKKVATDVYTVNVEVSPIELGNSTKDALSEYVDNLQTTDLNTEVIGAVNKQKELLSDIYHGYAVDVEVNISWVDEGYEIIDFCIPKVLAAAANDKLGAYNAVNEVFTAREYVKAYLDAEFKGEFADYIAITGSTEEEVIAEYESAFKDLGLGFYDVSQEQLDQIIFVYKELFKILPYEIGAAKKVSDGKFTVDVTVYPSSILLDVTKQTETAVYERGITEVSQFLDIYIELLTAALANPTFGEATTVTLNVEYVSYYGNSIPDEDLEALTSALLIVE